LREGAKQKLTLGRADQKRQPNWFPATAVTILVRLSINSLRRYDRQTNERRSHLETSQYRTASNVAIMSPRPYWNASKSNRSRVELRFVRFHLGGYLGIKIGDV
jgi:hypothetical protein